MSKNLEEILSRGHGNFEEQNKVLESSITIVNCRIVITNSYYTLHAEYNNYISNKHHLEECDKEQNLAVNVGCHCFLLKKKITTFCPKLRINVKLLLLLPLLLLLLLL
jgi:hypothetical protein